MNNNNINISMMNVNQYFTKINKHTLYKNRFISSDSLYIAKETLHDDFRNVHMISYEFPSYDDEYDNSVKIDTDSSKETLTDESAILNEFYRERQKNEHYINKIFEEQPPFISAKGTISLNNIQNEIIFFKDINYFLYNYHERYISLSDTFKSIDNKFNNRREESTRSGLVIPHSFSRSFNLENKSSEHSSITHWDKIKQIGDDSIISLSKNKERFPIFYSIVSVHNSEDHGLNVIYPSRLSNYFNSDCIVRSIFSTNNYQNEVVNITHLLNGTAPSDSLGSHYNITERSKYISRLSGNINDCDPNCSKFTLELIKTPIFSSNNSHYIDEMVDVINTSIDMGGTQDSNLPEMIKDQDQGFDIEKLSFFKEDDYNFYRSEQSNFYKPLEIDRNKQPNSTGFASNIPLDDSVPLFSSNRRNSSFNILSQFDYPENKSKTNVCFGNNTTNIHDASHIWKYAAFSHDNSITNSTVVDQNNFVSLSEISIINHLTTYCSYYKTKDSSIDGEIFNSTLKLTLTNPDIDKESLENDLETFGTVNDFQNDDHIKPPFLLKSIYNGMLLDIFYINNQVDTSFIKENIYNYLMNQQKNKSFSSNDRNKLFPISAESLKIPQIQINDSNHKLNFLNSLYLNTSLFSLNDQNGYMPYTSSMNNNVNIENIKYDCINDESLNSKFINSGYLATLLYTNVAASKYIKNLSNARIKLVKHGKCYIYDYYLINNNVDNEEIDIDNIDDDQVLNTNNIKFGFNLKEEYETEEDDVLEIITSLPKVFETVYKNHNNAIYNTVLKKNAQNLYEMNNDLNLKGDSDLVQKYNEFKKHNHRTYSNNDNSSCIKNMEMIHYSFNDIVGHNNHYDFNNIDLKNMLYSYKKDVDTVAENFILNELNLDKKSYDSNVNSIFDNLSGIEEDYLSNKKRDWRGDTLVGFLSGSMEIDSSFNMDNFNNVCFAKNYLKTYDEYIRIKHNNTKEYKINKEIILNLLFQTFVYNDPDVYDVYDSYGNIYKDLFSYDKIEVVRNPQNITHHMFRNSEICNNIYLYEISLRSRNIFSLDPILNYIDKLESLDYKVPMVNIEDRSRIINSNKDNKSIFMTFVNDLFPEESYFVEFVECLLSSAFVTFNTTDIDENVLDLIIKVLSQSRDHGNLLVTNSNYEKLTTYSQYLNISDEELHDIGLTYSEFFEQFSKFSCNLYDQIREMFNTIDNISEVILNNMDSRNNFRLMNRINNIRSFNNHINMQQFYEMFNYAIYRSTSYNLMELLNNDQIELIQYKPFMSILCDFIVNRIKDISTDYSTRGTNLIFDIPYISNITEVPEINNIEMLRINKLRKKNINFDGRNLLKDEELDRELISGIDNHCDVQYSGLCGYNIRLINSKKCSNPKNKSTAYFNIFSNAIKFLDNRAYKKDYICESFLMYYFTRQVSNIILFQKIFNACFMFKKNTTYKHLVDITYDFNNKITGSIRTNNINYIRKPNTDIKPEDLESGYYPHIMTGEHYENIYLSGNNRSMLVQTENTKNIDFVFLLFAINPNGDIVKMKKTKFRDFYSLCYINIESNMKHILKSHIVNYLDSKGKLTKEMFECFINDHNISVDKKTVVLILDDHKYSLQTAFLSEPQIQRCFYFRKNCDSLV